MAYIPKKRYPQMLDALSDAAGNVLKGGTVTMYLPDGTTVVSVKGNNDGTSAGVNPTFTDDQGYVPTYFSHGDYLAKWQVGANSRQRYIRIPPSFEDFGMVDATRYPGIVGDGVTDCAAAITQAVIDCQGKFCLFFPPGVYFLGSGVYVGEITGGWIKGAGRLTTFIAGPANLGSVFYNDGDWVDGFVLQDFNMDGNEDNRPQPTGLPGDNPPNDNLRIASNSQIINDIVVENVWSKGCPEAGFNIYISGAEGSHRVRVQNCYINGGRRDGIHIGGTDTAQLFGNVIEDVGDDGMIFNGTTNGIMNGNILIQKNAERTTGRNIWLFHATDCEVSGNVLYGGWRSNVTIESGSTLFPTGNVNVVGNVLMNAGEQNPSFGDAVFIRTTNNGIIENVDVIGNTIWGPRRSGVAMYNDDGPVNAHTFGAIDTVNIKNNNIRIDVSRTYGTSQGITDLNLNAAALRNVTVEGNTVDGGDLQGIYFNGLATGTSLAENIYIKGNHIRDLGSFISLQYAIQAADCTNLRVEDNDNDGDYTQGANIYNSKGTLMVRGNDLSRGSLPYISLSGLSAVTKMAVRDNLGFRPFNGVYALTGSVTWTQIGSTNVWQRTVTVPFGFTIPSGLGPSVRASVGTGGYFVSIGTISTTGFDAIVQSIGVQPAAGTSVNLHWQAEF